MTVVSSSGGPGSGRTLDGPLGLCVPPGSTGPGWVGGGQGPLHQRPGRSAEAQGKACSCRGRELCPEGQASPSRRGTASTGVSVVSPSHERTAWGAVSSQDTLQVQGPLTAALLGRHLLALRC